NATKMNGWGARVADKVSAMNAGASLPLMVSYAGGVFLAGGREQPYAPLVVFAPFFFGDTQNDFAVAKEYTQKIVATDINSHAARAANRTVRDGVFYADNMSELMRLPATFTWPSQDAFSFSAFSPIARMIAERQRYGLKRQIFFLRLDGFDHHTSQLGSQAQLLSLVSAGLHDFYAVTEQLGVQNNVTTFVLSDFGRTYKPAAGAGSDHGWGNHLFVAGGAVRGGDFYGKLPTLALGGPDDADGNGRWIPTTSVEQYAATLAAWFGLGPDEIREVFPNVGRFDKPNLGFLG
ncbi:MAG TPA: DUF1501 domain-containing protein, partial [Pyrinomonadaceae bacterium]|nr:DUF1501 domain-containing protein [Pyrinomonadaceae bacterium]